MQENVITELRAEIDRIQCQQMESVVAEQGKLREAQVRDHTYKYSVLSQSGRFSNRMLHFLNELNNFFKQIGLKQHLPIQSECLSESSRYSLRRSKLNLGAR